MNRVVIQNAPPRKIMQKAIDKVYPNRWRLMVVLAIFTLAIYSPNTNEIVVSALSDAFLAVSVFVAFTFLLIFSIEKLFAFDLGIVMAKNKKWQPVLASLLGILPGCGGAIVVVTQFTRGFVGFGALIAVLVSTMGDAAFLLLAREPLTAIYVFVISAIAGTITGMIVDKIHPHNFLRPKKDTKPIEKIIISKHKHSPKLHSIQKLWFVLIAFGFIFGIALALQINVENWFGSYAIYKPAFWLGAIAAMLCLLMWATVADGHSIYGSDARSTDPMAKRIIMDTNFVTSWVIMAFLLYEILTLLGFDIAVLFSTWGALAVLIAILIGFIPGCGPQIVITTLYLNGTIPFSALIANAIANDGDALFPAIALAPRAAIVATLYSAIPAFIIGYLFFIYGI